ncbi:dihydropteroate synthase [Lyticum sinuosum]|uniref:Dihydropteroate synthase n=1 Tax=Lyticum sinuosum TaxID=1332059 RepID=A0AAE4VM66_9RICK|nr:dihydropteroate synthase [Lyticum sinuosum]MDZ5761338.1 Dihydropteroate synthase [Lyticum sinuosum]
MIHTVYISLGSNIGNRLRNLQEAILLLIESKLLTNIKKSIVLETQAILSDNTPLEYADKSYLNMIISGETIKTPLDLLIDLKNIEKIMGRTESIYKYSPRIIDLDILFYDNLIINSNIITIPHPEIKNRDFIQYLLSLMGKQDLLDLLNIELRQKINEYPISFLNTYIINPKLVGIINLTQDSFSDGGKFYKLNDAIAHLQNLIEDGASIIEIGAQSTRPSAIIKSLEFEHIKLNEFLKEINENFSSKNINISIDTFHSSIIIDLIKKYNIYMINDVKNDLDDNCLRFISDSGCKFCFMHSLDIPPARNISYNINILNKLKEWCEKYLEKLIKLGFKIKNLVFDPGIGFGKNYLQNIDIIKNIEYFKDLGCDIMLGHSRKSYIKSFSNEKEAYQRDIETIAISLLVKNKVDFLRVHNVKDNMKALISQSVIYNE